MYKRNCEIKPGIEFPENMHRIAMTVEYNGFHYSGFQKQVNTTKTVQGDLEKALSYVAGEDITLICAGRTDTGVHATSQIIHFDTTANREKKAWTHGVNSRLPKSVRVTSAQEVSEYFHARFSATTRTYIYVIHECETTSTHLHGLVTSHQLRKGGHLNVEHMHAAAKQLLGRHDFSAFRAANCQAINPFREVYDISVTKKGDFISVKITANAYLYHMVRNIVGSLVEIGLGNQAVPWIAKLLEQKDRKLAAPTAPSAGLYFCHITYPDSLCRESFNKDVVTPWFY